MLNFATSDAASVGLCRGLYGELPEPLRAQIVHIWFDALGNESEYFREQVRSAYELIVNSLCREYGVFQLGAAKNYGDRHYMQELINFFLHERNAERVLDAVELSFRYVDRATRNWNYLGRSDASNRADAAIAEVNARFKEHYIGFQYADGEIIRIDSELLHAEVVKPVLHLLHGTHYAGAQQEFLKAHQHYRHGDAKEALNECLKSFESLMKAICDKRKWAYSKTATARELIQVCFDQNLIPIFWQSHYASLRGMLESGVPTGRNKLSGHGQGSTPTTVPLHVTSYMLHMTAAAMLFLAEAELAL